MTDQALGQCGLAGWGVVRIPWAEIPRWRRNPGAAEGLRAAAHLKLADEQAVLATAAVLQAAERTGLSPTSFGEWGVLAAPRYLGRARIAHIIIRYRAQGALSMPPLGIPTLSQHSVASTLCLILGCHGPSFGVSGNPTQASEVFVSGISMLRNPTCPGIWAVLTGWDPEPTPDGTGQVRAPAMGYGLAFALTAQAAAGAVRFVPANDANSAPGIASGKDALVELADYLEHSIAGDPWRLNIPGGGVVEIEPGERGAVPLRAAS